MNQLQQECTLAPEQPLSFAEIETRVCDIAAVELQLPREQVHPSSRLIDDLHCDSLELVELIMSLEDAFDVTIPTGGDNPVCKALFTRPEFRLSDLAEAIYLQRGTGKPDRKRWLGKSDKPQPPSPGSVPFCQLGGRWDADRELPLFERITDPATIPVYRRRSDGMRCLLLPAATVPIGTDDPAFDADSRPQHDAQLDSFLIDAETVSTTAYCRFLNSIGDIDGDTARDWFVLSESDDRTSHHLIERAESGWQPRRGCETWPMILVSWYGANAYALWANRRDWGRYRAEFSEDSFFLPSEAQWEYAARGPEPRQFPWGNEPESDERMQSGRGAAGDAFTANTLPLAPVNELQGMSPFGLHQMAGNVWQWCRDWYHDRFYGLAEARERNPVNRTPTGVRSERGGSWVGPAHLCRSSYRRGRSPYARGRCLGFRCVSDVFALK